MLVNALKYAYEHLIVILVIVEIIAARSNYAYIKVNNEEYLTYLKHIAREVCNN